MGKDLRIEMAQSARWPIKSPQMVELLREDFALGRWFA